MLIVDDRENEVVINKILMKMGDSDQTPTGKAKVKRLRAADYIIGSRGIEAKEINDLYRSIYGMGRSRTIVDQLRDLDENFDEPMLVVYGTTLKPYVRGKMTRKDYAIEIARMKHTILNFKLSFYQRFSRIKYMEFSTMDEFVDFLVKSHTNLEVMKKAQTPRPLVGRPSDIRVASLSSVRGVTEPIAEGILRKFSSIPNLLLKKTTQKELMEVDGVTRDIARRILSLREDYEN
tara:strand:+ start:266 stop:967 length:702 start_codon:yes stop_codon:yes gene_type:complete